MVHKSNSKNRIQKRINIDNDILIIYLAAATATAWIWFWKYWQIKGGCT